MRVRFILSSVLLTLILFSPAPSHAQKKNQVVPDRERERRSLATNVLRALNAAEANYKKTHGTYADWETLLGNGDFGQNGTKWSSDSYPTVQHAMYSRAPEITPGWRLRLTLSNDGKSYDAILEDATDAKCGYAAFTDDRGLVRTGRSVDCEP